MILLVLLHCLFKLESFLFIKRFIKIRVRDFLKFAIFHEKNEKFLISSLKKFLSKIINAHFYPNLKLDLCIELSQQQFYLKFYLQVENVVTFLFINIYCYTFICV